MPNLGSIQIHYDGDIIVNHEIPLSVLARTLSRVEASINRAHLIKKHGRAEKYRRMSSDDYEQVKFWIGKAEDGGYKLDLIAKTSYGRQAIDLLGQVMGNFVDSLNSQAEERVDSIPELVRTVQQSYNINNQALTYEEFKNMAEQDNTNFAIRSILKEYVPPLQYVSDTEKYGQNYLEVVFKGSRNYTVIFTPDKARMFKKVIERRTVGNAVRYEGELTLLNKKERTGKFKNDETGKISLLHIINDEDFMKVHPYLAPETKISFVGTPLYEYGATDPIAGDIYFIDIDT